MKLCQSCHQPLAEIITTCPSCGAGVEQGRKYIDDYEIIDVLYEGHASILCKAKVSSSSELMMIRIYKPQSGMNQEVADRLKNRLIELKNLPEDGFVRHHDIKESSDGIWYRVSEWVEAESWSKILSSGILKDNKVAFKLFLTIASKLDILHKTNHFIPHLILNDIMVIRNTDSELEVKIDYKLSRFLDPELQMTGTMLKNLINCHPDINNNRPLGYRSDIWSLGKVFYELLSADVSSCPGPLGINSLSIPQDGKTLLKLMISSDPGLRPGSMEEVVHALKRLIGQVDNGKKTKSSALSKTSREILKLRKTVFILATLFMLVLAGGVSSWYYFKTPVKDTAVLFEEYANQYSGSIAFVMVEYSLHVEEYLIYSRRVEGTAFLVDSAGYLLTNRHVVCPWLEDMNLFSAINRMKANSSNIQFNYRLFLWFEGEQAYKRLPGLAGSSDIEDIYSIENAYRSDAKPNVIIAGVSRPKVNMGYLNNSPLKDDFAVLKINQIPSGLVPLPLDKNFDPKKISKLAPVITLGFPLGSRLQANAVNVSVTRGNVRRTFNDMIQVDTSIYKGNSGGPIMNSEGKVIGIATGVVIDQASSIVPVVTALSDIGLILPISKAAKFLDELKTGQAKWNGQLDLSIEKKLEAIKDKAAMGQWKEAQDFADNHLKYSLEPSLLIAAAVMHICNDDLQGAKQLLIQNISVEEGNSYAKLLYYMIDWEKGISENNIYHKQLLNLNWISEVEFYGHLAKILEGTIKENIAKQSWSHSKEKSWIYYTLGLIQYKKKNLKKAEEFLKTAVLEGKNQYWVFYLAKAKLFQVQKDMFSTIKKKSLKKKYEKTINTFNHKVEDIIKTQAEVRKKIIPYTTKLLNIGIGIFEKTQLLESIYALDNSNNDILAALAYYYSVQDNWSKSLDYISQYLSKSGWENRTRLAAWLLKIEIQNITTDNQDEVQASLDEYYRMIKDPWYRSICTTLQGKTPENDLLNQANNQPELLLTAHTALAFWAEGKKDYKKALFHYKEALGSYLNDWWEYEFAKERIGILKLKLKQK
ncbi:MAG: trypsin-like serine protease [Deltaproteobacteria bacterium]|jgi:S1-C subfamily serine protease|nr:trypsin-like serine protease [Deltaproteobacteria bacterium]MBT4525582.1 trypsin-like serine protease [Deltaproteobacteria bacterium]